MKKYGLLFGFFALLFFVPVFSSAQIDTEEIEQVTFKQGKIIGSLPYGRHFYIQGSTVLPNGGIANKVSVNIWKTGRIKAARNRQLRPLTADETASILAGPPNITSNWYVGRTVDTLNFYLYIDRPLEMATEYILEFSFFERKRFDLSEGQKDEILQNIEDRVFGIFNREGGVKGNDIQKIVNEEVAKIASRDEDLAVFYPDQLISNRQFEVRLQPGALESVSRQFGRYSSSYLLIKQLKPQIESLKEELENPSLDSTDRESAEAQLEDFQAQIAFAQERINKLKEELPDLLQIIREQIVETYTSYVITQPGDLTVAEVDAVRIGTTFGGGMVGLNMLEESRDFDAFGYTALKFYLMPVDKRVAQAYVPNRFFINRLSVLVGFSLSGSINYRGNQLERAIGFFPVAGFSYDVNRYFSIDLGGTLFRQNSLSPLTQATKVRAAPILGVTFDIDIFNRFQSLLTGDQYQISPTGN